jgi:hypothetical protein
MEITKIDINLDFFIIVVITIIILLFSFPYFCQKAEQQKRNNIFEYIATFILLAAFLTPICFYNYYANFRKTNKYIIHYNQGTLKQTMTTQEIVDVIMSKSVYDEPSGNTSTITITLPKENNNKYDAFYRHIKEMEENTIDQKERIKQLEKDKNLNELKQKYLNETHQVDMKK